MYKAWLGESRLRTESVRFLILLSSLASASVKSDPASNRYSGDYLYRSGTITYYRCSRLQKYRATQHQKRLSGVNPHCLRMSVLKSAAG